MSKSVQFVDSAVRMLFVIGAVAVSLPHPARADDVITPPDVPSGLEVPAGNRPFLVGHAVGTQNYVCLPSGTGFAWTLFTPEATLFDDHHRQLITHFFSPDPRDGTIRATWEHSKDSSTVWAQLFRDPSTDAKFVAKGAVAWLILQKSVAQPGPTGGDTLTATTFIQRVNTSGGVAPPDGCSASGDVGKKAFVPYTADYFFFEDASETN